MTTTVNNMFIEMKQVFYRSKDSKIQNETCTYCRAGNNNHSVMSLVLDVTPSVGFKYNDYINYQMG